VEAANQAISSPLLEEISIAGAQGVLVNVTGGPSMSLVEVDEATEIIHEAAGEEANVILGAVIDENMADELMVTVIATGFNRRPPATMQIRTGRAPRVERIPTGVVELKNMDEPAYIRRGVDLAVPTLRTKSEDILKQREAEPERPAFLRKIMD
jgi:cell division protein FtsZ